MTISEAEDRKAKREKGNRYFAVVPVVEGKIYKVMGYHDQSEFVEAPSPIEACVKAKSKPRFTEAYFKAVECFQENMVCFALCLSLGDSLYSFAVDRIKTQPSDPPGKMNQDQ